MEYLNVLKFDTNKNTSMTILNYHFQYSLDGHSGFLNLMNTNEIDLLSGRKTGHEIFLNFDDDSDSRKFTVLKNEYSFTDKSSMNSVMQDLRSCKEAIYAENEGKNCVKHAIIEQFSLTNEYLKQAHGQRTMYVSEQINNIFKEVVGLDLLTQEGFSNDLKVKDKITSVVANEIRNSAVYGEALATVKMLDSKSKNINEVFLNSFTEKQREKLQGADIQLLARKMRLDSKSVDDFIKELPLTHHNIKTAVKLKEKQKVKELQKPKI